MQLDGGRVFDLLFGHLHLHIVGTDRDPGQRDEGQMAADQALLDGAEYRLIGFDVDVDVLEPADLLPSRSTRCLPCHSPMFS